MRSNQRVSDHRQGFPLFPRRKDAKRPLAILLALASFAFSGCGPRRVRLDFTGYEASYANTSNQELLLNLARLAQHDPTYFFKLGQISSSYRMQAGLTGVGQFVPQGATTGVEVPSGGGTPSAIYENDPAFSFIPVNDDTNARLLLQPVSEDLFYNLYQQGWRVDQLFRLLVDRIEITMPLNPENPDGNHCRVEIIRNVPPPSYFAPDYTRSPRMLSRYVTFLRVSAVVYALQQHGFLQLSGSDTFAPLDKMSALPGPPTAKDLVSAAANNELWEKQKDGTWVLGKKSLHPKFGLSLLEPESSNGQENEYGADVQAIKDLLDQDIAGDPSLSELQGPSELTDILEILYHGFAIGGSSSQPAPGQDSKIEPCSGASSGGASSPSNAAEKDSGANSGTVSCHLVLRSLIGLMAAAAQEEEAFDTLMSKDSSPEVQLSDPLVCEIHQTLLQNVQEKARASSPCPRPPGSELPFDKLVPGIERLPVLRLIWTDKTAPPPREDYDGVKRLGLAVNYRGQDFWITDYNYQVSTGDVAEAASNNPRAEMFPDNQYWNRDMFRLINELSSQVTVDISKFPLPDILQLRTE